jgi:hypothetical protein
MADLERLLSKLPNIVDQLNLNFGDRNKIKNEISRLGNILAKLNEIQGEIESELGFEKIKNAAMGALPFLGTVAGLFIPGGFLVDAVIAGGAGLLAEKFGNTEDEITLSDLQEKIYEWIGWVNSLQEIAEYLLDDSIIFSQINNYLSLSNINNNLQKIDGLIKVNLSLNNSELLKQQVKQISKSQEDLLTIQQRTNDTYDTLNSDNIYQIIIGLSNFYGNSGFSIEWLDDEHGLIIGSAGKFVSLADVINDCEYIQDKIGYLILNGNNLRSQAEEALQRLENNQNNKQLLSLSQELQIKVTNPIYKKYSYKIPIFIAIISTLLVATGAWISRNKLLQLQQNILISNQEEDAIKNFKSAQKIGMEVSLMVQNPPHPIEVWRKSYLKWQEAISLLDKIPEGTSVSKQAKEQISSYRINSQAISKRILTENKASENFELSQKLAIEAAILVQNPPHPVKTWKQAKDKWKRAINLLETIPEGTFVSNKAKEKVSIYKTNYAAVSTKVKD